VCDGIHASKTITRRIMLNSFYGKSEVSVRVHGKGRSVQGPGAASQRDRLSRKRRKLIDCVYIATITYLKVNVGEKHIKAVGNQL
jgi:hypothetical protein